MLPPQSSYYNVYTSLLSDPALWLCTAITVIVALLPDLLLQVTPCYLDHPSSPAQVWTNSKHELKPKPNKTVPYIDPLV